MNSEGSGPAIGFSSGRYRLLRHRRLWVLGAVAVVALAIVALRHQASSRAPSRSPPSALTQWWPWRMSALELTDRPALPTGLETTSFANMASCGQHETAVGEQAEEESDAEASDPASDGTPAEADASSAAEITFPPVRKLGPATPAERRIFDGMRRSPDAFAHAALLAVAALGDPDDPAVRLTRLAESAIHTADPRVYALAYKACNESVSQQQPAACGLLSVGQWARIDVGNGIPWMYALAEAGRQSDATLRDDALFPIGAAERIDDHFADVAAVLADNIPPDDDDATAAGFALAANSISGMLPLQTLINQCKAAEIDDANRRQVCSAIADKLIGHGSSAILEAIGGSIDRNLMGSAVRADQLRTQRDALLNNPTSLDFSCDGIRRKTYRLQRAARIGEMAALREERLQAAPTPSAP